MWRSVLAALGAYILIGIAVLITDWIFSVFIPGLSSGINVPTYYFAVSLLTDTVYSFFAGAYCAMVAKQHRATAIILLLAFGEALGIGAQVMQRGKVPLWFAAGLLILYPPAVWFGAKAWNFKR